MTEIRNNTVIVTGAAAGIGKGIALYLLEHQYQVFFFDKDEKALHSFFKKNYALLKEKAAFYAGDVTNMTDVQAAFEECIEKLGPVHSLISNAGIVEKADFLTMNEFTWNEILNVNLKGAFLWGQIVSRWFIKNKIAGNIVNIGCMRGRLVAKGMVAYATSKAGIRNLTKTMAVELAPYNIRVNAIEPGRTLTEALEKYMKNQEDVEKRLSLIPLGRFAVPEDIAKAVRFFISEESGYITGVVLPVDGGYSICKE
jgi:NAD(P)-dependent dehydrogenase (short-subunit alcohol dehydrogenase family)